MEAPALQLLQSFSGLPSLSCFTEQKGGIDAGLSSGEVCVRNSKKINSKD